MPLNDISDEWLSAFLGNRDPRATEREARFVAALLSPASRVLDLACGCGRHAGILASLGHDVVGLDRDARVLPRARAACTVVQAEMRHLPFLPESFDAALSMWQSFGYFEASDNAAVLSDLAGLVGPDGLLVLDLYNRKFFESISGERRFTRAGIEVHETTSLRGDRLNVRLGYHGGPFLDEFEWQVFSPQTLEDTASSAGWTVVGQFADFNLERHAEDNAPRIQYVLRRKRTA